MKRANDCSGGTMADKIRAYLKRKKVVRVDSVHKHGTDKDVDELIIIMNEI